MKINIEKIKGLNIREYIDFLLCYPENLLNKYYLFEAAKLRERELFYRAFQWQKYFLLKGTESVHYNKYKDLFNEKIKSIQKEKKVYKENADIRAFSVLIGVNPDKCIETIKTKILQTTNTARAFIYNAFEDMIRIENEKKNICNLYTETRLKEYENTNFEILDYMTKELIYPYIYKNDVYIYNEIIELLIYQYLASGTTGINEISEPQRLTIRKKIEMLKDIKVLDLPFFDINPLSTQKSQRAQGRFLSEIFGDGKSPNPEHVTRILLEVRNSKK